jgi:hypothetical protein
LKAAQPDRSRRDVARDLDVAAEGQLRGWPDNGEIDIVEHVGFDPGVIHGSVHTRAYNHVDRTRRTGRTTVETAHDQFHDYVVQWRPGNITVSVDRIRYFSFDNERLKNPQADWRQWPFDRDCRLRLNLAVGGNWGGQKAWTSRSGLSGSKSTTCGCISWGLTLANLRVPAPV